MRNFYWFWFGLTLWSTRLVLLCVLYFTDAPTGGPIVDRWYRFFPHTLVIEAGVAMALAFAGGLFSERDYGNYRSFLLRGGALMLLYASFTVGTPSRVLQTHATLRWLRARP